MKAYDPAGAHTPVAAAGQAHTILYKPHGAVTPAQNVLVADSDYVEVLTEIDIQTPIPDIDDAPRLSIREQVKALELKAERHLLEALENLSPSADGPVRSAIDGLAATARQWSRVTPRPALTRLADALPA